MACGSSLSIDMDDVRYSDRMRRGQSQVQFKFASISESHITTTLEKYSKVNERGCPLRDTFIDIYP